MEEKNTTRIDDDIQANFLVRDLEDEDLDDLDV